MFEAVEPFYGWLHIYSHEMDERSPYHLAEHSLFEYDRKIYNFNAHPLWDVIDSENLLIKILFVQYEEGYAIIEMLGEWNDLFQNDFKLLCQRCLTHLVDEGVDKFILICENVFHVYLDADDYYQDFASEIEDGWMCLLRARPHVQQEFVSYGISPYFYWNFALDQLQWRKLKPWQLFEQVQEQYGRLLLP